MSESESEKETLSKTPNDKVGEENQAASTTDSANILESLKAELNTQKEKAEENWNLFLRARAETDNIQRRARLDLENAHKYGIEKFAREVILVIDSLEHGLQAADAVIEPTTASIKEGMKLTLKLFLDTMEKFGIKQVNPAGEFFNPTFHEALAMQPSDEVEPNKILVVAQKGYNLQERVLRPARVVVARASNPTKIDEQA